VELIDDALTLLLLFDRSSSRGRMFWRNVGARDGKGVVAEKNGVVIALTDAVEVEHDVACNTTVRIRSSVIMVEKSFGDAVCGSILHILTVIVNNRYE
jgi:hypothetical protein